MRGGLKQVIEARFRENLMKKDSGKERARQGRRRAKAARQKRRKKREIKQDLRRNQEGIAKGLMAGEVLLVMATAWDFGKCWTSTDKALNGKW